MAGSPPRFLVSGRCLAQNLTLKNRDRDCRLVRRQGRLYVINKKKSRCKARQG